MATPIQKAWPDPLGSLPEGAIESGAQVRRKVLAELAFDPILHFGFRKRTELEPDLWSANRTSCGRNTW